MIPNVTDRGCHCIYQVHSPRVTLWCGFTSGFTCALFFFLSLVLTKNIQPLKNSMLFLRDLVEPGLQEMCSMMLRSTFLWKKRYFCWALSLKTEVSFVRELSSCFGGTERCHSTDHWWHRCRHGTRCYNRSIEAPHFLMPGDDGHIYCGHIYWWSY